MAQHGIDANPVLPELPESPSLGRVTAQLAAVQSELQSVKAQNQKLRMRGFGKISVNEPALRDALKAHPEVLAEAIQTALRVADVEMPYEKLKALTRGKQVTLEDLATFIDGLDISPEMKARLRNLRPETYTGLAGVLAKK